MTMRMIAHIGKPLELEVAACALLAAELAVELAAVAALETVDVAVWAAAAAAPPRPASNPDAPSAFDTSPGSAAAIALFWLLNIPRIADGSDQFDGSCWPIVPTTACVTAPINGCAAVWGTPAYWLSAPVRLARPPPPRRPLSILAPSPRSCVLPPVSAPLSLVKRSGSELEIASETFCAPPGAAAAVPSAARIAGSAAATSFWAIASLTPTARARLPTNCGVRYCCTRLTRLIAIAAPLDPARNDRRPSNRLSPAWRAPPHRKISCGAVNLDLRRAKS